MGNTTISKMWTTETAFLMIEQEKLIKENFEKIMTAVVCSKTNIKAETIKVITTYYYILLS